MAYFALFRRFHCFCQQGAAGNKDVAVMLTRPLVLHIGVVIIKISMLLIMMMVVQVIAMALVVRLFVRLSTTNNLLRHRNTFAQAATATTEP